jgi:septal ring factor EnvC (AmiA/AmiB activator)
MTPNWKMLGLPIVLSAALAAVPTVRGQVDGPPPGDQRVDVIGTALKALEAEVQRLKTEATNANLRAEKLQSEINDLKKNMGATTQVANYPPDLGRDLGEIKRQLDLLRLEIDALKKSPTTTTTHILSNQTGRVRFVNTYPEPMTIQVNQSPYQLLPNQQLELVVPAGLFTYQVPRVQALAQNRTLAPNETLTITVR